MPDVVDFSAPKRWTGWWLVIGEKGVLLCRVRARNYDAALNKARNRKETAGAAFTVVPEEKRS
jgi:hypothetical protein